MPKWSDPLVKADIIRLASGAGSVYEHTRRIREYFSDKSITEDAINCAWRRWRTNGDTLLPARFDAIRGAPVVNADGPPPPRFSRHGKRPLETPDAIHDHVVVGDIPVSGTVLITSDHHHPVSDKYAEAAVVAMARDIKPFAWVFNGDVLDAFWLSAFDKPAGRVAAGHTRIVDEADSFRPLGKEASRICKQVWIGEGNHEQRLARTINAMPGLHGLPGLSWPKIFDLPSNVRFLEHGYRLKLGPVQMMHGDKVASSNPTRWSLQRHGLRTVVFGHTHRMAMTYQTTWDEKPPRTVVAVSGGTLCDFQAQDYAFEPDWQHGCVLVHYFQINGKTRYSVHPIHITDGRFAYGGRLYNGHKNQ